MAAALAGADLECYTERYDLFLRIYLSAANRSFSLSHSNDRGYDEESFLAVAFSIVLCYFRKWAVDH